MNVSGMGLLHVLGIDIYSMPKLVLCSTAGTLVSFLLGKARTVFRDVSIPSQYIQNSWQSNQNSSASLLYYAKSTRICCQFFISADSDFPEFYALYGIRQLNLSVTCRYTQTSKILLRLRQSQRMNHTLITACHHLVYSFIHAKTKMVMGCDCTAQSREPVHC